MAPSIVGGVIRSPGQPLTGSARDFMEARFGYDFGHVRIHTDARAAESARAVGALAYTVGRDVVFGAGQFAPEVGEGRRLLAHELAHVVQQEAAPGTDVATTVEKISSPFDPAELAAERTATAVMSDAPVPAADVKVRGHFSRMLARKIGSIHCPPNTFGAPDDPRASLEALDPLAADLASQAAEALATDAESTREGIPDPPSATFQSYQDHFGLPNPAGGGFLNRLTGRVRPSQAAAASEELRILSIRFRLVARTFSGNITYRCVGQAPITLSGCATGSCGPGDGAFTCRGSSSIALCAPFWTVFASDEARAAGLIHEAFHMNFGRAATPIQGEIGDTPQRGTGRNFNIAACYGNIVGDMAGFDAQQACPDPPA